MIGRTTHPNYLREPSTAQDVAVQALEIEAPHEAGPGEMYVDPDTGQLVQMGIAFVLGVHS